ncbi:unnamed protein product [Durusdinium trenchii]|uniref:Uncharacterized protein n=2 Tax=Durusdinium trenchii TaxID=1381693 RepID=A0ABP0PBN1_9DINO
MLHLLALEARGLPGGDVVPWQDQFQYPFSGSYDHYVMERSWNFDERRVFVDAIVCMLATFTGDIRFQPNGYSESFYHLPSLLGLLGIVLGFVGLLGIYDDKPNWLQWLVFYLLVKLVALAASGLADFWTLRKCDSWLTSPERNTSPNEQLTELAEAGVCPWARLAYAVGSCMVVAFWTYCTYFTYTYWQQLECNPAYPIDFGAERHGAQGRWDHFQVKDPRLPEHEEGLPLLPQHLMHEESEVDGYGTQTQKVRTQPSHYGPDGQEMDSEA